MSGKALTEDGLDNPVENTASSASGDDEEMLLEPRFKYTRILNNMPSVRFLQRFRTRLRVVFPFESFILKSESIALLHLFWDRRITL